MAKDLYDLLILVLLFLSSFALQAAALSTSACPLWRDDLQTPEAWPMRFIASCPRRSVSGRTATRVQLFVGSRAGIDI